MPKKYHLFLKGYVGDWDFNPDMVNYVLDKYKDAEVHVLIDSLGGSTDAALSISSLFKLHGNVHVHYVGMNASAATIAAMGAKHISIDADALFLVHKCMNFVFEWDYMNEEQLDAHIRSLEKMKKDQQTVNACIAGMYARRCKKTKDDLLELMKEGAWLTANQALEWGFVDEITDDKDDRKPELDDKTVSFITSAGIPMPPINISAKKGSILERFLAFVQSFSNRAPEDSADDAIKLSPLMAKLSALAGLLGVSLSMVDNKLSLSEDQVLMVNDALDENKKTIDSLNREIERLKASIAEKDKTIADLRKEPAVDTVDVADDKKDDVDPYAPVSEAEAIAASKAFLEIL